VQEALPSHTRASDIQGALTMGIIIEYIQVWDLLLEVQLQPKVDDTHKWRLAASGQYSAKLSYDSLFMVLLCLSHVIGCGNHGRRLSVIYLYGL
jgi:hypothetical protein